MKPRWYKVVRDLLSNKSRTVLVVLAIAVGVFAFGSVFITQDVLLKNMNDEYIASHASTITLYLSDFDSSLISWIKNQPGVLNSSGKSSHSVKINVKGKDEILNLASVPDFNKMQLNLLRPQKGSWPPLKGELALERNSFTGGKFSIGDTVDIKTLENRNYQLILTGSVYDNSAIPYIFTNQMTGFISWETLSLLGFSKRLNQVDIATTSDIITLDDAEKLAFDLSENLKDRGVEVNGTQVFKPNQHWATDNSKAFTAILSVIGIFSLILSGFLVINTISALLAQQKKQIGIMKAIGGNRRQIASLYLVMVAFYGLLALLIALPVGMALGYVFLKLVTDFLNMDIISFYLPLRVFVMELGAALVVPIIAAAIPVVQGTKTSVRSVISDYQSVTKVGRVDHLLAKFTGLSRPLTISIRNTFRKKGRLALTLGTLVTAGALFIGVINVRTGMFREMDRILQMFDFQVNINLNDDYAVESLVNRIGEVENVETVEARTGLSARRIKPDGTKGAQFGISGLPYNTVFSHPVILSGRWLEEADINQIVLSSSYVRDNPDIGPGDILNIAVGRDKYNMEVVGIIAMSSDQKLGFAQFSTVAQMKDKPGLASSYLIKTIPQDPNTQQAVAEKIEERLKTSGITVVSKETKSEIINSAANQFNFLIFFLLAMAVMVAFVGGLGLAGTMSLNVLERTREIGIMRSIGANDAMIRKLVITEGTIIGVASWLIAIPLSLPLTYGFCVAIGNAFFGRTLVFAVVPAGMFIWLMVAMLIAVIASILPANRASRISISETLSYE